jgi:uncharacterized protein
MKLLLFLLAVVALLWLLRGSWRRTRPPPKSPHDSPGQALMLRCAQCGLHLPQDEALPGRGGVFCGEAHRAAFEQAHPDR